MCYRKWHFKLKVNVHWLESLKESKNEISLHTRRETILICVFFYILFDSFYVRGSIKKFSFFSFPIFFSAKNQSLNIFAQFDIYFRLFLLLFFFFFIQNIFIKDLLLYFPFHFRFILTLHKFYIVSTFCITSRALTKKKSWIQLLAWLDQFWQSNFVRLNMFCTNDDSNLINWTKTIGVFTSQVSTRFSF